MKLYSWGDRLYVLSPDRRALVKAAKKGKKNWKESTTYTDDKGRKWLFNMDTRRWGLHPDFKKGKKGKDKEVPLTGLKVERKAPELEGLNNIVPFDLRSSRELNGFICQIGDALKELQMPEELRGRIARQSAIETLTKIYKERISRNDAKIAALKKQLFETLHPRKLVRVPKGTTQKRYAEIVQKLADGDKEAIKEFTETKPKGYKTAVDRKQAKHIAESRKKQKSKKPKKMSKSLAVFDGILYELRGTNFVKSSQQLSLFDESAHPRDGGGRFTSKSEVVSQMKQGVPKALAHLDAGAAKMKQKIASMPLSKLQDYDPELDLNDVHLLNAIDKHMSVDHPDGEEILDDADTHFPELGQRYMEHYHALSSAIDTRIKQLEQNVADTHNNALESFDAESTNLLESVETLADWHVAKGKITELYQNSLASGRSRLKELGASSDDIEDFKETLKDSFSEILDSYSDDPEDWED